MVHLQKGQWESQLQQNKKKINIVSGPDQRRWTSGLSWCEYTLTKASINYAEQWKITSES